MGYLSEQSSSDDVSSQPRRKSQDIVHRINETRLHEQTTENYTAEFRREAVQLTETGGQPIAELARKLDIKELHIRSDS